MENSGYLSASDAERRTYYDHMAHVIELLVTGQYTGETWLQEMIGVPELTSVHVHQLRQMQLAMRMIDLALHVMLTSPIFPHVQQLVAQELEAINQGPVQAIKTTRLTMRALLLYEAALTDDHELWNAQFDNPAEAEAALEKMRVLRIQMEQRPLTQD